MLKEKIGFIGGGKMSEAICRGLINTMQSKIENLMVSDVIKDRCIYLHEELSIKTTQSNHDVVSFADVVILAVKPQIMDKVLQDIKDSVTSRNLIVSIAAGITIQFIETCLHDNTHVIRVMPNTPCLVGASATAFSSGKNATHEDELLVNNIFSAVGKVFQVEEEHLNAVTGLSGSGPAYVYMFIEALSDGGVKMGLPRDLAVALAAQTVFGSAKVVLEAEKHPAQLKDTVTSPGGTTIEGVSKLEEGGLRSAVINAVEAATLKSKFLGNVNK